MKQGFIYASSRQQIAQRRFGKLYQSGAFDHDPCDQNIFGIAIAPELIGHRRPCENSIDMSRSIVWQRQQSCGKRVGNWRRFDEVARKHDCSPSLVTSLGQEFRPRRRCGVIDLSSAAVLHGLQKRLKCHRNARHEMQFGSSAHIAGQADNSSVDFRRSDAVNPCLCQAERILYFYAHYFPPIVGITTNTFVINERHSAAIYNLRLATYLSLMLRVSNILNLSDISSSAIRALRNRCSSPLPIEQRRGAVRRLGFAPIPGRRFNSPVKGCIPNGQQAKHSLAQLADWGWNNEKYMFASQSEKERQAGEEAREAGLPSSGTFGDAEIVTHWLKSSSLQDAGLHEPVKSVSNPGASRGERADWDDPAPHLRSQTLPGCIQAKHAAAAKSPDAVFWAGGHAAHAGIKPGRARNSFRLSMRGARAGHTPMRAGRGDNAPLMKGRARAGRLTHNLDHRPAHPALVGE